MNKSVFTKTLAVFLCLILAVGIFASVYAYDETYNPDVENIITERGLQNFEKANRYSSQFTDVPSSAWYYDNVKAAFEYGLVTGTSATSFNPTGNLTIAEAVTLAARLNNIYYAEGKLFTQTSVWYQVYVDYAVEKGIITANQFANYTKQATRAEYTLILAKALPPEALEIVNWVEDGAIPDVKSSDSYGAAVYMLYRAGILTGNDDLGTFSPSNSITRAEVSALVTRMSDVSLRKTVTLKN